MNWLRYANGFGHLIMSVSSMATGLLLILLSTDPTAHAIGVTLIMTVSGYWFVPGAAKQVASEIVNALPASTKKKEQVQNAIGTSDPPGRSGELH